MRKRVFLLMAGALALSIAAPAVAAPSFWAGLLTNGSFRFGPFTTGPSTNSGSNTNSGGIQYANTQGTTGISFVGQVEAAAGFKDGDEDSLEQGMIAGMSQTVANTGDGSATGSQAGGAVQTQSNDCGTQSQYVGGVQYAYVSTSEGGSAVVTQTATVVTYQSQECTETPENNVIPLE